MASSSQAELASVALEKPVETADPSRSSTVDVETSAPPQSADPPAKSEEPIAARKSKKKSKSKRKKISTAHLTVIQQQMEDLASQLRQAEEARTKVEAGEKITEQEQVSIDKRSATSAALEQLQALYAKLSSPDMLGDTASKKKEEDKKVASTSKRSPEYEQQRSLTLLHFFYIVRLAQQGFFTIISSVYPRLEPLAIVHLCDKLVGGSLFAAKDLSEEVRLSKRKEVFSLLRKLNDGVDEPIDEGFVTTFREIREIIHHLIDNSLDASSDPQRAGWTQRMPTPQSSTPSSQPLLVVVPYNSMIDTSLLPIQAPYASAYVNSGAFSDYYDPVDSVHPESSAPIKEPSSSPGSELVQETASVADKEPSLKAETATEAQLATTEETTAETTEGTTEETTKSAADSAAETANTTEPKEKSDAADEEPLVSTEAESPPEAEIASEAWQSQNTQNRVERSFSNESERGRGRGGRGGRRRGRGRGRGGSYRGDFRARGYFSRTGWMNDSKAPAESQ